MFTWGSKYLLGVAVAAYVIAGVYGLASGGSLVGVASLGYKGGVGEHVGYTILVAAAFVALFLGVVSVVTRDGNAEEVAALAGVEGVVTVRPPSGPTPLGPLAAFGVACLAVGVAISVAFLYLGIAILFVVVLQWLVQAWSDRATGDDEVNAVLRDRILSPLQVPMLGMLAIAVVAIGLSRIFLAVSEIGAVVVASVAAGFIFLSAVLIAKARAPRPIVSAIVAFGAVAVLAGGIVGAVVGERDFHHGEGGEEHGEESEEVSE